MNRFYRIILAGRSDDMNIYFDCEFDAVKSGDKHHQCVVSIGAIDAEAQATFYTLVKPKNFKHVSHYVAKITQLQDKEILTAPSFAKVMKSFHAWARVPQEKATLYSFGPDDKRTIIAHAAYEGVDELSVFDEVIDLQKILSETITYEGTLVSPTLSLDDLKYAYEIEGDVVHNALNDAMDLMKIHKAYLAGQKPSTANIKKIVERKLEKQEESRRKQQERMLAVIKERYQKMDKKVLVIPMYPAVRELLSFLEEQEHTYHVKFLKQGMQVQNRLLPYQDQTITLIWYVLDACPHLIAKLSILEDEVNIPLTYRNASIYESITKCRMTKEYEEHTYQNNKIIKKRYEPFMLADMMSLYYDTIHTINCEDYTKEQLDAWAPLEYDEEGMQQRFSLSHTITAWKQGKLVGFANLTKHGVLDCLYVHKEEQMEHIGAMLVQDIEATAQKQGYERLEAHVSITAKPFFEKMGYIRIRKNHVKRKKQTLVNFTMRKSI